MQLTIDCAEPSRLVRFWAAALDYVPEPPPGGAESWVAWYRSIGVPEHELAGMSDDDVDRIVDPAGVGPKIWFQPVPEPKQVKNRLHLDLGVGGGRTVPLATRRERVEAVAARLTAIGATQVRVLAEPGMDHFGITMADPEGNEFCLH